MIDNINKKNTKYTLNEVIENTIQAPSDRQVIIDNAVKKGIVGDGEDSLSISSYSTKKTNKKKYEWQVMMLLILNLMRSYIRIQTECQYQQPMTELIP